MSVLWGCVSVGGVYMSGCECVCWGVCECLEGVCVLGVSVVCVCESLGGGVCGGVWV